MCVGVLDETGLLADEKKMSKKKDPPETKTKTLNSDSVANSL